MGKKVGWIAAVKRILISESKGTNDQTRKSKKWFGTQKDFEVVHFSEPHVDDVEKNEAKEEQTKRAYTVAIATAKAAEAAVAAAQAAAQVVRLATIPLFSGKSREEIAATRIQTAFRRLLARRALHALRGLVRLRILVQGPSNKRQAASTLRSMQTLARVQSQIRSRRIRMSEENRALQKQLQRKREKELEKLKTSMGEEWEDSPRSKEQIEARLQSKQEAAMRRERAMAYAYSHQRMWKKSLRSANPTFMDPINPHWGWSWLERWMADRPWETQSAMDSCDNVPVKRRTSLRHVGKPSPSARSLSLPSSPQSPSTPTKSASPKRIVHYRRHSIGGSAEVENESLASSPSVGSSQKVKARSRLPSPLGIGIRTLDKVSAEYAKKRHSFSASPVGR